MEGGGGQWKKNNHKQTKGTTAILSTIKKKVKINVFFKSFFNFLSWRQRKFRF